MKRWPWIPLALVGCFDFGELDAPDSGLPPVVDVGFLEPGDAAPNDLGPPCVEGPVIGEPGVSVSIESSSVDPLVVRVPAGGVVIWTNLDDMRHRMRAGEPGAPIPDDEGGFDTRDLSNGATYARRFCDRRTLTYYCSSHPSRMRGYQVMVE